MIELPDDLRDMRVDRADGITFDEAIAARDTFEIEGRCIPIIGRAALRRNQRAAGRAQDLADLAALTSAAPGG